MRTPMAATSEAESTLRSSASSSSTMRVRLGRGSGSWAGTTPRWLPGFRSRSSTRSDAMARSSCALQTSPHIHSAAHHRLGHHCDVSVRRVEIHPCFLELASCRITVGLRSGPSCVRRAVDVRASVVCASDPHLDSDVPVEGRALVVDGIAGEAFSSCCVEACVVEYRGSVTDVGTHACERKSGSL